MENLKLENNEANKLIRLAADNRFNADPLENLIEYVGRGIYQEQITAIGAIGWLKYRSAFPVLAGMLARCEQSLKKKLASTDEGDPSGGYPLQLAAEILIAYARLDCEATHKELDKRRMGCGNIYLRAEAIRTAGYECDWHDKGTVLFFLSHPRARFRVAAANAIYLMGGFRLADYMPHLITMVRDPSPEVVISVADVLALIANDDESIEALQSLLEDNRFSKVHHMTVSRHISSYLGYR